MRYHRKEGASWFRYTPQHFYCRNCGVEIRSVILPLGYFAWAVMAGLFCPGRGGSLLSALVGSCGPV